MEWILIFHLGSCWFKLLPNSFKVLIGVTSVIVASQSMNVNCDIFAHIFSCLIRLPSRRNTSPGKRTLWRQNMITQYSCHKISTLATLLANRDPLTSDRTGGAHKAGSQGGAPHHLSVSIWFTANIVSAFC